MFDEKLLQEVTAKAKTWLSESYDEQTRAEVQAMLDNVHDVLPQPACRSDAGRWQHVRAVRRRVAHEREG